MPTTPTTAAQPPAVSTASPKPPWRFAIERRLGRRARQLLGVAEQQLPDALAIVGAHAALAATRADSWALACLERAADADEGSPLQDAWVLLAACRPTVVRRTIHGPSTAAPSGRRNRRLDGQPASDRAEQR